MATLDDINISNKGVSTQLPVLKDGDYPVRVDDYDLRESKAGNPLLVVITKLVNSAESEAGKTVNAGFPLRRGFSLAPSPKSPDWDFREGPAQFLKGALKIENDEDIPDLNSDSLKAAQGKVLIARVVAQDGTDSDGNKTGRRQNEIKAFLAIKEAPADAVSTD